MGIGARLVRWRKSKGMKGYELAMVLDISQGSLSDIENGKSNPAASTIASFMENTDICVYWLLTGKDINRDTRETIDVEKFLADNIQKVLNEYHELKLF